MSQVLQAADAAPKIHTGRIARPFRMLIHGTEGIGKSTFATAAPNPIFISTEDGTDELDCAKFDLCKTEKDFNVCMGWLLHSEHQFQTVVIDTVDWMEKLWADSILDEGKKTIASYPYGEYYQILEDRAKRLIKGLNWLRNNKKMNVILIAHSKLDKVTDPMGAAYDQYSVRLEKRVSAILKEWVDIIGFANFDVRKQELREGFSKRTVATLEESYMPAEGNRMEVRTRVLTCTGHPTIVAKCRYASSQELKFEEKIPLNGKFFFENLQRIIWAK